jgi:hypothetical protein
MRIERVLLVCLISALALAQESKTLLLHSFDDFKAVDTLDAHTTDLKIFSSGLVKITESFRNQPKKTYETRLSAQKLQHITALLNSKGMKGVPAKIGSQIKVIDGPTDKKLEIHRGENHQTITIENFYPALNTQRPTYAPALVELECNLMEIERKATKRPPPTPALDWCADLFGNTSSQKKK